MPRKKIEPTRTTPPAPKVERRVEPPKVEKKDTAVVSVEVDERTHRAMMAAAASWGYSLNEWLREIISDSI